MISIDNVLIYRFTLAAGISAILQVLLLILMFTVSRKPFGRMSDYFYVLTPLLMLPFFLSLHRIPVMQNSNINWIIQLLGIIGLVVASGTEVVLLLKLIDFRQSIWGNLIGLGLAGIPILVLSIVSFGKTAFPAGFNWLGIALGAAMVIGIPSVFFFIDAFLALGHSSGFNWSKANPLVYPAVIAGILTQVGLPIWLIWASWWIPSGNLIF